MSTRPVNPPVTVIGDGAWGTTLAILLAEKGAPVTLWSAFADQVTAIGKAGVNEKFLPGIKIPASIQITADLKEAIRAGELIVLAVPSQYLQSVLRSMSRHDLKGKSFVSVVKGIDIKTLFTMSRLIEQELGKVRLAVLSGPTIAIEVARHIPTTAVAASRNKAFAQRVQAIFSCSYFRVYTNDDVLGVELCGSIKNVIALACGVCDGLGFGTNTKAAILTRGLVEMARFGRALGAKPDTFMGLAGLGDLATTSFSPNSRNRTVGEALGKGRTLAEILGGMDAVAEGVGTAKALHKAAKKIGVDMPITDAVYKIIQGRQAPGKTVAALMSRSLKSEGRR